jgi:hypothetical protein
MSWEAPADINVSESIPTENIYNKLKAKHTASRLVTHVIHGIFTPNRKRCDKQSAWAEETKLIYIMVGNVLEGRPLQIPDYIYDGKNPAKRNQGK